MVSDGTLIESDGKIALALRTWLQAEPVPQRWLDHAPTLTSEASASARGESLAVGGKALLLKIDGEFALFVLSAARSLDNSLIKAQFKPKSMRFATPQELWDLAGLVPGSVPPFGRPLLPWQLYVDHSSLQHPVIAFNAGLLRQSCVLDCLAWQRLAQPVSLVFSKAR